MAGAWRYGAGNGQVCPESMAIRHVTVAGGPKQLDPLLVQRLLPFRCDLPEPLVDGQRGQPDGLVQSLNDS